MTGQTVVPIWPDDVSFAFRGIARPSFNLCCLATYETVDFLAFWSVRFELSCLTVDWCISIRH